MQMFTATLSVLALCGGMASARWHVHGIVSHNNLFNLLDKDVSDALDKEEFNPQTYYKEGLRLNYPIRDSLLTDELMNEPDEFFEIFDSNGNGKITMN